MMSNFSFQKSGLIAVEAGCILCRIMTYIGFEGSAENEQERSFKLLELFEMVPRDGVEPSRPMLSYPRILSPKIRTANKLESLNISEFTKSRGPNSGRIRMRKVSRYALFSPSEINQSNQSNKKTGTVRSARDLRGSGGKLQWQRDSQTQINGKWPGGESLEV